VLGAVFVVVSLPLVVVVVALLVVVVAELAAPRIIGFAKPLASSSGTIVVQFAVSALIVASLLACCATVPYTPPKTTCSNREKSAGGEI
jgi:hypothetical protein